eukprot:TRINITY_DN9039_c0_g1_i2.p1 TRINITY_DN9039_c0_g1~~TRINITY_DN9039_c0_g1_i2.p1  ORF type:complete len:146 (-),score=37.77 TRINITY_DN9039_c0_g1_i2:34-471(-)
MQAKPEENEYANNELDFQLNAKNTAFDQQTATNVKNHIKLVEDLIAATQIQLSQYKKEYENLKQYLAAMKQKIELNNEEASNTSRPTINAMLKNLKLAIASQKEENAKIQSQITELKKEKSQIQQLIISCVQKLAQLEEQVGQYV